MNISKRNFIQNPYLIMIVVLIACRLLAMFIIPLNDTTEARYAEIARKMLETGNWITLQHDYGIPFWAKPPLSTWLSALSMKCLGVNAFAARLPNLLLSVLILWLVGKLASICFNRTIAWRAMFILTSTVFFLLNAGTVMTDTTLLFSLTLMMVSFWLTVAQNKLSWRYWFFVGAGLGLLAKGPIAIVLAGIPIFFWTLLHNKWRGLWQKLPWLTGTCLTLLIALPWYLLAEYRTPGFLNYFIVGEHINRFLKPGWHGDKYGFAHAAPYGMIWVFAFIGTLPWSGVCLNWIFTQKSKWKETYHTNKPLIRYLLFFMLTPLLFFTFARNIIYPYVFPSLPAFALLFTLLSEQVSISLHTLKRRFLVLSAIPAVLLIMATTVFMIQPLKVSKSQKYIINAWQLHSKGANRNLIYWANKTDFSAQFYSSGHAIATLDKKFLEQQISQNKSNYVVINNDVSKPFPKSLIPCLEKPVSVQVAKQTEILFHVKSTCLNGKGREVA